MQRPAQTLIKPLSLATLGTYLFRQIILSFFLFTLAACGTLNRAESNRPVFRGLDQTDHQIKTCKSAPMFGCFGLEPLIYPFVWVSYPIDLVMDTLLYPIDKSYERKLQREFHAHRPSITMQAYMVNLSEPLTFQLSSSFFPPYFSQKYMKVGIPSPIFLKTTERPLPITDYAYYKGDDNLLDNKLILPNPSRKSIHSSALYVERIVTSPGKETTYRYDIRPLGYDQESRFVALIFLPCNQFEMRFFTTKTQMERDIAAPIAERGAILKQQESQGQCPALADNVKVTTRSYS